METVVYVVISAVGIISLLSVWRLWNRYDAHQEIRSTLMWTPRDREDNELVDPIPMYETLEKDEDEAEELSEPQPRLVPNSDLKAFLADLKRRLAEGQDLAVYGPWEVGLHPTSYREIPVNGPVLLKEVKRKYITGELLGQEVLLLAEQIEEVVVL